MFKKIKEFNDRNTAIYFFGAIIVLIAVLAITNRNKKVETPVIEEPKPVEKEEIITNYSYDIKINKNNEIILFTINFYNNKYLISKTELGKETKYYIHYIDIYEQNVLGNYVLFRNNEIVSGIDNKLLFWDYINNIVSNNTDCFINNEYNSTICPLEDGISIKNDSYEITYKLYNINSTNDFNINIS